MLEYTFLGCAIIGGGVMIFQIALTLLGIGGDEAGDFDAGGLDADVDFDAGDFDVADHTSMTDAADGDLHGDASGRIFAMVSLRTVIAAVAFFGIGGMAALRSELNPIPSFAIASACGFGAMYGTYSLMKWIYGFNSKGNLRISSAVGKSAKVYIPIAGDNAAPGKIQLEVQGRIVEYQATTAHTEKLATGSLVRVVRVVGPDTVEVAPLEDATSQVAQQPPEENVA